MNDILKGLVQGTPKNIKAATANIGAVVFTGTGLNDGTSGGVYTAVVDHTYTIIIDGNGTPDTFKWKKDSGSFTTGVGITGAAQTLADGVTIHFGATTGHTIGDQWVITVTAGITINPQTGQGKTGALHRIVINNIGSGVTIALYDGTSSSGTLLGTIGGTLVVGALEYNLEFLTALYIAVYASTTYPDLTVVTT